MSHVTPKLCNAVVDPPMRHTATSRAAHRNSIYKRLTSICSKCKQSIEPKPTGIILKGKPDEDLKIVFNKTTDERPIDTGVSSFHVTNNALNNSFKKRSTETWCHVKSVDGAVNTDATGRLRCDSNCVTIVRRRDNQITCKCAPRRAFNIKTGNKETQCFKIDPHYSRHDKASGKVLEQSSCATQIVEKANSSSAQGNRLKLNQVYFNRPRTENNRFSNGILSCNTWSIHNSNQMTPRKWALSRYPTRGPDF